jgi:hypothetical protein
MSYKPGGGGALTHLTALCKAVIMTIAILLLGVAAGSTGDTAAGDISLEGTGRQDDFARAFSDALEAIALLPTDISFRNDYTEIDSFRLGIVDELMADPMRVPAYCESLAQKSFESDIAMLTLLLAAELELRPLGSAWLEQPPEQRAKRWLDRYAQIIPRRVSKESTFQNVAEQSQVLDSGLRDAILTLAHGIFAARMERHVVFESLDSQEVEFLKETISLMLLEDEFDPTIPIQEKEKKTKHEEEVAEELLRIAPRAAIDRNLSGAAILALAYQSALDNIRNSPKPSGAAKAETEFASGDIILAIENDRIGPIIVGGYGETTYTGDAAIIIDLGGDDIYLNNAGGATEEIPFAIVIDLQGDDTYRCGDYSIGSGFFGVGILSDLQGDDTYQAGNFSMGSGVFGVGILIDENGNDTYYGDTTTEGAGAFGIGILKDLHGNDSYTGRFFCQAFASVKGFGLLADNEGNDYYFAGGKYTDELRYFDHYLSLSQGFAIGWRPEASGGIAILADRAGNDVYISDIFGQGSSYWFSLAGLVDFAGNDNYVSYQYAQGAGTHLTVAALVDMEGDDNYNSKGVSQGCGHDLAAGILYDYSGDDNYACHDLSQAAGNANGFGLLVDFDGSDSYSVRNPKNTHGYGNFRRDYGSIGMFIDLAGEDSYSGRGGDGEFWTSSRYGVGLDREEVSADD